jgi:hypothetical protein
LTGLHVLLKPIISLWPAAVGDPRSRIPVINFRWVSAEPEE